MTVAKRVVVVDDDSYTLRLAAHCLKPPEFELYTYGDARDALMKLHDIAPDIIVSDIVMPSGMDGRTFFQVVKRSPQLRGVPFIFLSALRASEELAPLLDGGADDFLTKPFPLSSLVAKIRATVRMAERLAHPEPGSDSISGNVGAEGALSVLRFCEDHRLTGRVSVEARHRALRVEFAGGEVIGAEASPPWGSGNVAKLLLAMKGASYSMEHRSRRSGNGESDAASTHDGGPLRTALVALLRESRRRKPAKAASVPSAPAEAVPVPTPSPELASRAVDPGPAALAQLAPALGGADTARATAPAVVAPRPRPTRDWLRIAVVLVLISPLLLSLAGAAWLVQRTLRRSEVATTRPPDRAGVVVPAAPIVPDPPAHGVPSSPPAAPSVLRLNSNPPGATVFVARKPRGVTPLRLSLEPGTTAVLLRKDGFVPWARQVKLASGLEARLEATLTALPRRPAPAAEPAAASVRPGDLVPLTPDVTPPRRVSAIGPAFKGPVPSLKHPVSVLVAFVVTEHGSVTDARIVESGGEVFDRACLEAIAERRYEPAVLKGVRVKVAQVARFTFQPR